MPTIKMIGRTVDYWGQGHYGAPRGSRKHKGEDFECTPGSKVLSEFWGEVTKHGFPYDDDDDHDGKPDYNYIEIKDANGNKCRYFYVKPLVAVGTYVLPGQVIGIAEDIAKKYPDITPHIHIEVKDECGKFFDPKDYLKS
jgi:murein DD-endopeptidase MepM/ murein hydrolase activator NlpD